MIELMHNNLALTMIDELYTSRHSTRHMIESMHNNLALTIIDELYTPRHSTRPCVLSQCIVISLTIDELCTASDIQRGMRLSRDADYIYYHNNNRVMRIESRCK